MPARDVLNTIGASTGINVTYDTQFQDRPHWALRRRPLEQATPADLMTNRSSTRSSTRRPSSSSPTSHRSTHSTTRWGARVLRLARRRRGAAQTLNTVYADPDDAGAAADAAEQEANTIPSAPRPVMEVIEPSSGQTDKPRAKSSSTCRSSRSPEATRDIASTSTTTLGLTFSPEVAPRIQRLHSATNRRRSPQYYLPRSHGPTSTYRADRDGQVPRAGWHTKLIANAAAARRGGDEAHAQPGRPIRGSSTVFGAAAAGGFASVPQSSVNYKDVGVNIEMTPRVTLLRGIILDGSSSRARARAQHQASAGQDRPSPFSSAR